MALDIFEELKCAQTIGITGHIKPDGDCVGSCLALMAYLRKVFPEATVELFLEKPEYSFDNIPLREEINSDYPERGDFDVYIVCDTNNELIGDAQRYFDKDRKTNNIDHFSNTRPQTMRICADLMEYSFDFSKMLDDSFFARTAMTNRLLAHALLESRFFHDDRLIIGKTDWKLMRELGASRDDTGGIVERLRITRGVECAIYIYEKKPGQWKASLRSSSDLVNVALVGEVFGGGGHARASGCEYNGDPEDFIKRLAEEVGRQLGTT